jgi:hypothetical protein
MSMQKFVIVNKRTKGTSANTCRQRLLDCRKPFNSQHDLITRLTKSRMSGEWQVLILCTGIVFLWNEVQWPRYPTRISYKYNKLAGIIPIPVQHIKTCHSPDIIDLVQRVIKSYCELNGFLQSSSLCLHVFADVPFVLLLTITNFCIDIFYPKVICWNVIQSCKHNYPTIIKKIFATGKVVSILHLIKRSASQEIPISKIFSTIVIG